MCALPGCARWAGRPAGRPISAPAPVYENAIRLFAVPYETLHRLAQTVSLDDQRLVLVYSVGRTGSTLLAAALNAVEGITGLSEPDVFTQLVAYRLEQGSDEAEISALVESCLKIQCKPTEQIPHPTIHRPDFLIP